jgi:hypothetical protein
MIYGKTEVIKSKPVLEECTTNPALALMFDWIVASALRNQQLTA